MEIIALAHTSWRVCFGASGNVLSFRPGGSVEAEANNKPQVIRSCTYLTQLKKVALVSSRPSGGHGTRLTHVEERGGASQPVIVPKRVAPPPFHRHCSTKRNYVVDKVGTMGISFHQSALPQDHRQHARVASRVDPPTRPQHSIHTYSHTDTHTRMHEYISTSIYIPEYPGRNAGPPGEQHGRSGFPVPPPPILPFSVTCIPVCSYVEQIGR